MALQQSGLDFHDENRWMVLSLVSFTDMLEASDGAENLRDIRLRFRCTSFYPLRYRKSSTNIKKVLDFTPSGDCVNLKSMHLFYVELKVNTRISFSSSTPWRSVWRVDLLLHSFLKSALGGGERSNSSLRRLTPSSFKQNSYSWQDGDSGFWYVHVYVLMFVAAYNNNRFESGWHLESLSSHLWRYSHFSELTLHLNQKKTPHFLAQFIYVLHMILTVNKLQCSV